MEQSSVYIQFSAFQESLFAVQNGLRKKVAIERTDLVSAAPNFIFNIVRFVIDFLQLLPLVIAEDNLMWCDGSMFGCVIHYISMPFSAIAAINSTANIVIICILALILLSICIFYMCTAANFRKRDVNVSGFRFVNIFYIILWLVFFTDIINLCMSEFSCHYHLIHLSEDTCGGALYYLSALCSSICLVCLLLLGFLLTVTSPLIDLRRVKGTMSSARIDIFSSFVKIIVVMLYQIVHSGEHFDYVYIESGAHRMAASVIDIILFSFLCVVQFLFVSHHRDGDNRLRLAVYSASFGLSIIACARAAIILVEGPVENPISNYWYGIAGSISACLGFAVAIHRKTRLGALLQADINKMTADYDPNYINDLLLILQEDHEPTQALLSPATNNNITPYTSVMPSGATMLTGSALFNTQPALTQQQQQPQNTLIHNNSNHYDSVSNSQNNFHNMNNYATQQQPIATSSPDASPFISGTNKFNFNNYNNNKPINTSTNLQLLSSSSKPVPQSLHRNSGDNQKGNHGSFPQYSDSLSKGFDLVNYEDSRPVFFSSNNNKNPNLSAEYPAFVPQMTHLNYGNRNNNQSNSMYSGAQYNHIYNQAANNNSIRNHMGNYVMNQSNLNVNDNRYSHEGNISEDDVEGSSEGVIAEMIPQSHGSKSQNFLDKRNKNFNSHINNVTNFDSRINSKASNNTFEPYSRSHGHDPSDDSNRIHFGHVHGNGNGGVIFSHSNYQDVQPSHQRHNINNGAVAKNNTFFLNGHTFISPEPNQQPQQQQQNQFLSVKPFQHSPSSAMSSSSRNDNPKSATNSPYRQLDAFSVADNQTLHAEDLPLANQALLSTNVDTLPASRLRLQNYMLGQSFSELFKSLIFDCDLEILLRDMSEDWVRLAPSQQTVAHGCVVQIMAALTMKYSGSVNGSGTYYAWFAVACLALFNDLTSASFSVKLAFDCNPNLETNFICYLLQKACEEARNTLISAKQSRKQSGVSDLASFRRWTNTARLHHERTLVSLRRFFKTFISGGTNRIQGIEQSQKYIPPADRQFIKDCRSQLQDALSALKNANNAYESLHQRFSTAPEAQILFSAFNRQFFRSDSDSKQESLNDDVSNSMVSSLGSGLTESPKQQKLTHVSDIVKRTFALVRGVSGVVLIVVAGLTIFFTLMNLKELRNVEKWLDGFTEARAVFDAIPDSCINVNRMFLSFRDTRSDLKDAIEASIGPVLTSINARGGTASQDTAADGEDCKIVLESTRIVQDCIIYYRTGDTYIDRADSESGIITVDSPIADYPLSVADLTSELYTRANTRYLAKEYNTTTVVSVDSQYIVFPDGSTPYRYSAHGIFFNDAGATGAYTPYPPLQGLVILVGKTSRNGRAGYLLREEIPSFVTELKDAANLLQQVATNLKMDKIISSLSSPMYELRVFKDNSEEFDVRDLAFQETISLIATGLDNVYTAISYNMDFNDVYVTSSFKTLSDFCSSHNMEKSENILDLFTEHLLNFISNAVVVVIACTVSAAVSAVLGGIITVKLIRSYLSEFDRSDDVTPSLAIIATLPKSELRKLAKNVSALRIDRGILDPDDEKAPLANIRISKKSQRNLLNGVNASGSHQTKSLSNGDEQTVTGGTAGTVEFSFRPDRRTTFSAQSNKQTASISYNFPDEPEMAGKGFHVKGLAYNDGKEIVTLNKMQPYNDGRSALNTGSAAMNKRNDNGPMRLRRRCTDENDVEPQYGDAQEESLSSVDELKNQLNAPFEFDTCGDATEYHENIKALKRMDLIERDASFQNSVSDLGEGILHVTPGEPKKPSNSLNNSDIFMKKHRQEQYTISSSHAQSSSVDNPKEKSNIGIDRSTPNNISSNVKPKTLLPVRSSSKDKDSHSEDIDNLTNSTSKKSTSSQIVSSFGMMFSIFKRPISRMFIILWTIVLAFIIAVLFVSKSAVEGYKQFYVDIRTMIHVTYQMSTAALQSVNVVQAADIDRFRSTTYEEYCEVFDYAIHEAHSSFITLMDRVEDNGKTTVGRRSSIREHMVYDPYCFAEPCDDTRPDSMYYPMQNLTFQGAMRSVVTFQSEGEEFLDKYDDGAERYIDASDKNIFFLIEALMTDIRPSMKAIRATFSDEAIQTVVTDTQNQYICLGCGLGLMLLVMAIVEFVIRRQHKKFNDAVLLLKIVPARILDDYRVVERVLGVQDEEVDDFGHANHV